MTDEKLESTRAWNGRAIGACPNCGSGVAYEGKEGGTKASCPNCGTPVRLAYVYGNKSGQPCDWTCMGALGKWCSCACGGVNHGKVWVPIELVPTWTAADKERVTKIRAKRVTDFADRIVRKRVAKEDKERNGREKLLAEFPELTKLTDVDWYFADNESGLGSFMSDMKHALSKGEMSGRQVEATLRAIEKIDARRAREAKWKAEREAAVDKATQDGVRVKAGRYVFEGSIISVREDDDPFSYSGGTKIKILVLADDQRKLWGTLPSKLRVLFNQDDNGSDSYKGRRITFTATVKPSDDDPLFGFFSRPVKGAWVKETSGN